MKQKWVVIGLGILALFLILYTKTQVMGMSTVDFGGLWMGLGQTGQYFIFGLIVVLFVVGFFYGDEKVK